MMAELPDIAGMAHVAAKDWLALRHRLAAIGVDAHGVAPILALCAQYPEDDRDPIRLWHLRRRNDAAALATRLLMFGDALTAVESTTALGDDLYRLLSAAGLLVPSGDAVRCVLRLGMAEDFYLFADDLAPGGHAVMGMRETTVPTLLLSRLARKVVATDINPRAVALARINVALNAADNIDVRAGDLFAPVAGETFDLIATHPPYIALPDGAPSVTNLHGGPRGDELACRLLAALTPHLAPSGRAVVQAHWPLRQGETLAARIRAERIDRFMQSCDLLYGTDAALLASRLRLPEAASLATIETPPGSGATRKILLPPPGALRGALDVTPETELVLTAVQRAPTVAESGQKLAAVRAALALGMLEPAKV